jgi:Fe-S-cluster containining protein
MHRQDRTSENIDAWFKQIREKYGNQMQCGKGCTACCHGLFDISLADAVEVARGFQRLTDSVQRDVHSKAETLYGAIAPATSGSSGPSLFSEDDTRVDAIVDSANNPKCPLLGPSGECRIYEHRPLACRLEGAPMVDIHQGLFGDWCELNFKEGIPVGAMIDFQQDYDRIDAIQEALSARVARQAALDNPRAITFIPSVIVEYDKFWKNLLKPLSWRAGWKESGKNGLIEGILGTDTGILGTDTEFQVRTSDSWTHSEFFGVKFGVCPRINAGVYL